MYYILDKLCFLLRISRIGQDQQSPDQYAKDHDLPTAPYLLLS